MIGPHAYRDNTCHVPSFSNFHVRKTGLGSMQDDQIDFRLCCTSSQDASEISSRIAF